MHIYTRAISSLLKRAWLKNSDTVLVLAGGSFDRQTILDLGLSNVTISNLDFHDARRDYAPFVWKRLDAENIDVQDGSYDWVVIHAGLHHLAVPAAGVCEMLRVARKGILCIEARDSLLMKLASSVGLTSDYELEPALLSDGALGGYRNGPIPNYVYRWTEREFEKTINSFAPTHQHTFFYDYGFSVPIQRFAMAKSPLYRLTGRVISKLTRIAEFVLPRQGNQFAFGVLKNSRRQPWLTAELKFDETYLSAKYDKSNYPKVAGT